MSSSQEIPAWLREQLARYEQLQQNLQAIMVQKQQVDLESSDIERALAELKKAGESDAVYRSAGNLLVKANKENVTKDLIEKKELSSTRSAVLTKQEQRVRENLKDLEAKIQDAVKTRPGPAPQANAQSP